MPAITKSWVTIADSAVDPDSPLDAALMTGLRDDLVHLREWLGASFTAGAVQDHNHDGSNSAAIEIGPNWLRNGGFSNGTTGWTTTAYTGGTVTTGTSNETEGTAGLVITSTNATNGGGKAESSEFIPVVASQTRQFMMSIKGSVANCPLKAEVLWFDDAQASISNSTIVSTTTTTPTGERLVVRRIAAPSTAKFCKIRLELPAAGAATGSVYFDAVIVTTPQTLGGMKVFTSNDTFGDAADEPWGDVYVEVVGGGGGSRGSGNGGGGGSSSFAATGGTLTGSGGGGGTTARGAGGSASGGTINIPGGSGIDMAAAGDQAHGGASILGFSGVSGGGAGVGYGGGGSCNNSYPAGAGGGGGYSAGWVLNNGAATVTVGSAGTAGSAGGYAGAPGVVIVRW